MVAPTNANLVSELLYTPEYMNLTQLIANYRALPSDGAVNASTLLPSLTDFETHYKENPVAQESVEALPDLVSSLIG